MKKTFLRICCGFLLLSMALGVCMGFVVRVYGQKLPTLRQIPFAGKGQIALFSREGKLLEILSAGAFGTVSSRPLPEGIYYAFSGDGCTEFSLDEDGSLTIQAGSGWFDGSCLHLCRESGGTLWLKLPARNADFHTCSLTGGTFFRQRILRRRGKEELLCCRFDELPFGVYLLFLDGKLADKIAISRQKPFQCISFP